MSISRAQKFPDGIVILSMVNFVRPKFIAHLLLIFIASLFHSGVTPFDLILNIFDTAPDFDIYG